MSSSAWEDSAFAAFAAASLSADPVDDFSSAASASASSRLMAPLRSLHRTHPVLAGADVLLDSAQVDTPSDEAWVLSGKTAERIGCRSLHGRMSISTRHNKSAHTHKRHVKDSV
jgi:hypothetical protein